METLEEASIHSLTETDFCFFFKGGKKGQRGNKQQLLVTFTKIHKYTGEWDVPVFHLTVGLKLKNKKKKTINVF